METKVVVLGLWINGATILRNLSKKGYEMWGITHDPKEEGLCSGYGKKLICPNPEHEFDKWVSFMIHLGKNIKGEPALIPTSDIYVLALDKASNKLKKYFRFYKLKNNLQTKLTSKLNQHILAEKHNFPCPKWERASKSSEFVSFAKKINKPVLLKPEFSPDWKTDEAQKALDEAKVLIVSDINKAKKAFELASQFSNCLIAEEFIPGSDKNLLYWAGFVRKDGKVAGRIIGQKTRVTPPNEGSASFVELVDNPKLEKQCEQFLRKISYNGLCGIEVKLDPRDNKFKLIEVNPRYGLWEDIGIPTGVDVAHDAILELCGKTPQIKRPLSFKQKWVALHRDVPVFPEYRKLGEISFVSWINSLMPPIIYNDFPLFSDPKYAISMASLFSKKLLLKVKRDYFN